MRKVVWGLPLPVFLVAALLLLLLAIHLNARAWLLILSIAGVGCGFAGLMMFARRLRKD